MKIDFIVVENESRGAEGTEDEVFTSLATYDAEWLPTVGTALTVTGDFGFGPVRVLAVAVTGDDRFVRSARVFVRKRKQDLRTTDSLRAEWLNAQPEVSAAMRQSFMWVVSCMDGAVKRLLRSLS